MGKKNYLRSLYPYKTFTTYWFPKNNTRMETLTTMHSSNLEKNLTFETVGSLTFKIVIRTFRRVEKSQPGLTTLRKTETGWNIQRNLTPSSKPANPWTSNTGSNFAFVKKFPTPTWKKFGICVTCPKSTPSPNVRLETTSVRL